MYKKRYWFISFISISVLLMVLTRQLYFLARNGFGEVIANWITVFLVLVSVALGTIGIVLAATIHGNVREKIHALQNRSRLGEAVEPFAIRLFRWRIYEYRYEPVNFLQPTQSQHLIAETHIAEIQISQGRKARKHSKYPYERRRQVVMKWENRNSEIMTCTIEEFLEQEFGSALGGVPNVPASTFYDWRRKIFEREKIGIKPENEP